jgi:DNA-binding NarL/FixJ family response regulator
MTLRPGVVLRDDPARSAGTGTIVGMSVKIRVLLADDQTLVRTGFRVILEAEGDIEVVAEAVTGHDAIRQAQLTKPDVILMDIRMPELDGLSATEEILRQANPPTIVVLTTFDRSEYVYRALRAGAAGFLLKDAPATRLIAAVRAAATGDSLIDPAITRRLVERFAEPAQPQGLPGELASLTDPGTRRPAAARPRTRQCRDSRRAGGGGDHGQNARRPDPRQARPARPGAGGGARLRDRVRHPRPRWLTPLNRAALGCRPQAA